MQEFQSLRRNKKIHLILRPSRFFFTLLSGLHLLFLLLTCIAGFSWWLLLFLFIFIAVSYCWLLRKYIYRKSQYTIAHLWQDHEVEDPHSWFIVFSNIKIKQPIPAKLKAKGYVSDFVIIMHFTIIREADFYTPSQLAQISRLAHIVRFVLRYFKTMSIPVLIFPDMVDYKDYHALKLFLMGY